MVKTKIGEFSHDLMWSSNVAWDAFHGLLSVFFGLLRILSSVAVFIGCSRGSVIVYVAIVLLVRPLTMLTNRTSFYQSCELDFSSFFKYSKGLPYAAYVVYCSNKFFRRMAGLDRLVFQESLKEDALNNNVAEYVTRGKQNRLGRG